MTKLALISDVHANLEALEAVLDSIDQQHIKDIISLGDNIGYGPDPVGVLEKLHSREVLTLEGNHDLAVVNPRSFSDATDLAIDALEWTRTQLAEATKNSQEFHEILQHYLGTQSFFTLQEDPKVIFVHGAPGPAKNAFDYLLHPEDILYAARYMKKKGLKICFFGHTHQQAFWEVDRSGVSLIEFSIGQPVVFTDQEVSQAQLLVNPGSVGQPRDGNPQAAYAIYERVDDSHIFTFYRVDYNFEKTIRKIYAIPKLDNALGDRLLFGA